MQGRCDAKMEAAKGVLERLWDIISDARVLGIGTGSTVSKFIELAYERGAFAGKIVVPSSIDTALILRRMGVDVSMPHVVDRIEVYIDGADEVDNHGNLVKGGGGALLGEKILARASEVNVIVVDESKLVERLGTTRPVPIEIVPWALAATIRAIETLGYRVELRSSAGKRGPIVSDWGGVIADVYTGPIEDPRELDATLKSIPGVVDTGLFVGLTDYVSVGLHSCGYRVIRYERE